MGLFGPNWSWEEWQKKEELYGELDKQTDKLINGLKQQQDENEYNRLRREQVNAMNDYANSLSKEEHRLIRKIPKEARKLSKANIRTNILTLTPDLSIVQGGSLHVLISCFLVLVLIVCLVINPFKDPKDGDLFLIILIFYWTRIYRIPLNLIQAIYEFISIRKTNCFKELVKDMKNINFKNVEYIGVSSTCVKIKEKSGSKKNLNYSNYDFPNLPYTKFGILLAALMWEFKLILKFKVKAMTYRKENTVRLYVLGDRDVNVPFGSDETVFSETEQNQSELELFNHTVYAEKKTFIWEKLNNKIKDLNSSNNIRKEESKKKRQGKTW